MENKTAVLPFTFCDNLVSIFAVPVISSSVPQSTTDPSHLRWYFHPKLQILPQFLKTNQIKKFISYLSVATAVRVKTLAQMDKTATNWLILQYNHPKDQLPFNMYAKLNVTFKVDTIVSATAKFTKNIFVTVRIRLWLHTIHITIRFPPVATTTIGKNREFHSNVSHNSSWNGFSVWFSSVLL